MNDLMVVMATSYTVSVLVVLYIILAYTVTT